MLTIVAILGAVAGTAHGRVFNYTDEHGIVHYTDRPPETDTQVEIAHFDPKPESALRIHQRGTEQAPEWVFENRTHGPLEVEVRPAEQSNVRTTPALPGRFVLPPASQTRLFDLAPKDPARGWRFRFNTRYMPGDPGARHNSRARYLPPFAPGAEFTIGQAFGGSFSHNDPQNRHAVDISMPIGTPIHAARAGVVMETERWFEEGGENRDRYLDQSNYIRILHDDGTMATYAHLDYRGTLVRPGQVVLEGEPIGRSGNTGFSTGPHLHFVVHRNAGMRLESVPFRFLDGDGKPATPRRGQRLRRSE